jgi:5-methylcytosine-specific restriction endonuclease McrA
MSNRRLKCKQCRLYVDRNEVVSSNCGNFCTSECMREFLGEKRQKKRDATRQAKRRAKPRVRSIPLDVRAEVYRRDQETCRWCLRPGEQVHHVIYRSQGGPDTTDNLILLCGRCHERAHSSKEAFQPLLLEYLELAEQGIRTTIPEIAARHRRLGALTELQQARLAS